MTTPRYAQVLVDVDAKVLDRRTFTYAIPSGWEEVVQIGSAVTVPFGKMKHVTGFVVGFTQHVAGTFQIKEMVDILDETPLFDVDYLAFLQWIADYYATPLIAVLATALPSSLVEKTKREVIFYPERLSSEWAYQQPRHIQQMLAFFAQRTNKPVRVRYVASQTGLPIKLVNQSLYQLQKSGLVSLQTSTQGRMQAKTKRWVRLFQSKTSSQLSKRQQTVWQLLQQLPQDTCLLSEAATAVQTTPVMFQKLAALELLQILDLPEHRDRSVVQYYAPSTDPPKTLNAEQAQAVQQILSAPRQTHVLYGVTGSGKTEVYLALAEAMLEQGKSVLVMVPEISLTSHLAKRFIQRFGWQQVVLWHSQLSAGEKVDAWHRIYNGELKVVIGARSAIFTPLDNLGLIVMDEAHEGSFKQDNPAPRYHAKTLAQHRMAQTGATLVLGSATPEVEAYYEAMHNQRVIRLNQRFASRPMADVTVVDMRHEADSGRGGAVSAPLKRMLEEVIAAEEQAILLLNRRGFHTTVQCESCDTIVECPQCSVAVTFHRFKQTVRCHYCGDEAPKPQYCKQCASSRLSFLGMGTQRLEEAISTQIPTARVLRLDSDVMQKKNAYRDVLEAFSRREADILIGTQVVAKGLDIANVTLVGVVAADGTFALPDYKSAERGFQLLTQVAGRAGRGDKPGRVIFQTHQPQHPVIMYAQAQDYDAFYADEITRREMFDFPPYSQLFRLMVSGVEEPQAFQFLHHMSLTLKQHLGHANLLGPVQLLGPAPCVIARIQGRYRFQVMIKNKAGSLGHQLITTFYNSVQVPDGLHFMLDVDAQSFL